VKNELDSVTINEYNHLVSFGVISFFTNIPYKLIIDVLKTNWHFITLHKFFSEADVPSSISTLFDCTYLTFNEKFYK